MINSVIFDLGQVLIDFCPEKGMRDLGFSEDTIKEFNEKIFSELWEKCDRVPYSNEEIRELFKRHIPGYEKEVDYLWDNIGVVTNLRKFSNNWIKELKARGYKLYVLSNFGKVAFEINSRGFDFLKYMDGIVVSYEIQKCKPEKEMYEELTKRFNVIPENAVFIDDRKVNVDGAIACGFKGVLFENYEQAAKELDCILNGQ